jgi:lactoylglutathione lyase
MVSMPWSNHCSRATALRLLRFAGRFAATVRQRIVFNDAFPIISTPDLRRALGS